MDFFNQQLSYNVDICLCIDKTGSMGPIIDTVRQNALNLYRDVLDSLENHGKHVGQFRVRVIWFGDYGADETPILLTDFLKMPEQLSQYESFVNSVKPEGGGDVPEDGLEALAYSIRSDWVRTGWRKRHIIALFTDAPAHDLGFGKSSPLYPKSGMPENFGELSAMWGNKDYPGEMDNSAKRLLLFAPDDSYWKNIKLYWNNVVMTPVSLAAGLQDVGYQTMIDAIVNSV